MPMPRFGFPSRKKSAPQLTVTAPLTNKAQKILGASALNIDSVTPWEEHPVPPIRHDYAASSYASSIRSGYKSERGGFARSESEWGAESEVIPRQHRVEAPSTGAYDDDMSSEMSTILRRNESSSTIASYYDKSKQPLSVSQQTSNSAMAKGLPTKAQRMLDMENQQSPSAFTLKKQKKKPDLPHILTRPQDKRSRKPWNGPMLSSEDVSKSPSLLSPTSPSSHFSQFRSRLQRRPTKESLRSMQSEPPPESKEPSRRPAPQHLNGLPNLYEHYEQMSFREAMGDDENEIPEERGTDGKPIPDRSAKPNALASSPRSPILKTKQSAPVLLPTQTTKPIQTSNLHLPGYHDESVISQYAKRVLPQTPQTTTSATSSKAGQSSPTDYAASISSRHTRTSKASKRTETSFQDSDLQEKSVLSLSSDSEDDYEESIFRGPPSAPEYPLSDRSSFIDHRPRTSRTTESADNKRQSRRGSLAPTNNFLAIPSHVKPPPINIRSSSMSGSSGNTIHEGTAPRSSSRLSSLSSSSVNTTMTWQSKPETGLQQARPILPRHNPKASEVDAESDRAPAPQKSASSSDEEPEQETAPEPEPEKKAEYEPEPEPVPLFLPSKRYVPPTATRSSGHTENVNTLADQPTPPLSPSSVDFYIRSARTSVDGQAANHNRVMAVTRQEEMLLSALRHKRQIMRESVLHEIDDGSRQEKQMPKGHQSKASEATITADTFDLEFPAPPSCDNTKVSADGTTIIDLRHGSSNGQLRASRTMESLKLGNMETAPDSQTLASANEESTLADRHERILLYLDHHLDAEHEIDESEPSPDLSEFMDFEVHASGSTDAVNEVLMLAQQRSRRSHRHAKQHQPQVADRPNAAAQTMSHKERDVPRPDSPISPAVLATGGSRRPTVNKKTARLSAVGLL